MSLPRLLSALAISAVLRPSSAAATSPAPPPAPSPSAFDAEFTAPGDGPAQNMPVGNGEVAANVWVDGVRNGSLALLLGRSDVFTGDMQPLKLGRLRIELDPNPFASAFAGCAACQPPAAGPAYTEHPGMIGDNGAFLSKDFACSNSTACPAEAQASCDSLPTCRSFAIDPKWVPAGERAAAQLYHSGLAGASANPAWALWVRQCAPPPPAPADLAKFSQTLDLQRAVVNITAADVSISVWSDINSVDTADSIHIELLSARTPIMVSVYIDSWRTADRNISSKNNARGPCTDTIPLPADIFAPSDPSRPAGSLSWWQTNRCALDPAGGGAPTPPPPPRAHSNRGMLSHPGVCSRSVFGSTLEDQHMGALAARTADPLLGRTSGAHILSLSSLSLTIPSLVALAPPCLAPTSR